MDCIRDGETGAFGEEQISDAKDIAARIETDVLMGTSREPGRATEAKAVERGPCVPGGAVAVNSAGEVRQLSLFIRLLMGFCYRREGLSIGLETWMGCGFSEMRPRRANQGAPAGLAFLSTFVNIEGLLKPSCFSASRY
jgi:hypothetical protein